VLGGGAGKGQGTAGVQPGQGAGRYTPGGQWGFHVNLYYNAGLLKWGYFEGLVLETQLIFYIGYEQLVK